MGDDCRMNKPSYQTNDPKGWCGDIKRGAALGRPTIAGDSSFAGKLYLRHITLDSGGYDRNGTYFGHGARLFWCSDADGNVDRMLRAPNRDAAKSQILELYPQAKFFR